MAKLGQGSGDEKYEGYEGTAIAFALATHQSF